MTEQVKVCKCFMSGTLLFTRKSRP